jgi:hypothetical protein
MWQHSQILQRSPTSGSRSVSIVRSRTQATELVNYEILRQISHAPNKDYYSLVPLYDRQGRGALTPSLYSGDAGLKSWPGDRAVGFISPPCKHRGNTSN